MQVGMGKDSDRSDEAGLLMHCKSMRPVGFARSDRVDVRRGTDQDERVGTARCAKCYRTPVMNRCAIALLMLLLAGCSTTMKDDPEIPRVTPALVAAGGS